LRVADRIAAGAFPDVLLLSLGTTLGWRMADRLLVAQLQAAGAGVEAVSVSFGAAGRLRRGYPLNDFVEMHAARRAFRTAVARTRPRAVIVSSTTAAMLAPRLRVPVAVRLDAPARLNRPGLRNAGLRLLERRSLGAADLVLPFSHAARAELPRGAARSLVVHPPVDPSGPPPERRERAAVAYVPDPKAKGLDVLAAGWARAAIPDARLEVYGLDPGWARAHLARAGVGEPAGLELCGTVGAGEFRRRLRSARVFVATARWEDYGQAPLEALADGALLATVPSGGPYEALRLARRLEPALVAGEVSGPALAGPLRAAFELPDERADALRESARELLAPYRSAAVGRLVAEDLLPALLDGERSISRR